MPDRRGDRQVQGLPAAALTAGWIANGAILGVLTLWVAGLRLYLPGPVYVVAVWAFVSAVFGWLRDVPWRSVGAVLLVAGGFLLESTYAQLLMLAGFALLTDGAALAGLPAWRSGEAGLSAEPTERR